MIRDLVISLEVISRILLCLGLLLSLVALLTKFPLELLLDDFLVSLVLDEADFSGL